MLIIAGISNESDLFDMMLHPECDIDLELGNTGGRAFFKSILEAVNA